MIQLDEIVSKNQEFARIYAQIAHDDEGQVRKGSGARYWTHPQGVADTLEELDAPEKVLIAAELHDTEEDTSVKDEYVRDNWGDEVADLVKEVTNSPDLDGLGKEDYMNEKLCKISDEALMIKLSDMLYNASDNPRLNQLERMHNNIVYLQSHRDLDNPIHKTLLGRFRKAYLAKKKEIGDPFSR